MISENDKKLCYRLESLAISFERRPGIEAREAAEKMRQAAKRIRALS